MSRYTGEGGGSTYTTMEKPEYIVQTISPVTSVEDVTTEDGLNGGLAKIVTGAKVNGVKVKGLITMTKDGVEVPVTEGAYTADDKVIIAITNYLEDVDEDGDMLPLGSWGAGNGELSGLPTAPPCPSGTARLGRIPPSAPPSAAPFPAPPPPM